MNGFYLTRQGTYRVSFRMNGKVVRGGTYQTPELARAAYLKMRYGERETQFIGPLTEIDTLKAKYQYDPETGHFYTRAAHFQRGGRPVGGLTSVGYLTIVAGSRRYLAHRVAWLLTHDRWPLNLIDHINGIKTDNRLCNLREATQQENLRNVIRKKVNNSGYRGVSVRTDRARGRRFFSCIKVSGEVIRLGDFDNPETAHAAYLEAQKRYFGEFAPQAR